MNQDKRVELAGIWNDIFAGGGAHPQRKTGWKWGESLENQGFVFRQGAMWMFLMMVISGENMAKKLSKTAFIQGKYVNS